mmetsp:Transcript_21437/g.60358  ORF Transcript_21437/g.60358 Transcript_21437/m.60358 type:complete len:229 (-) Transcript_21437:300-986(-)
MRPSFASCALVQNRARRLVSPRRSLRAKSLYAVGSPSRTQPCLRTVRQLRAFPWNSSSSSARRMMMSHICCMAGPTVSTPPARWATHRSKSRSGCTVPTWTRAGGSTGAAIAALVATPSAPCEPSSLTPSSSFSTFPLMGSTLIFFVSTSPHGASFRFSAMASCQNLFAFLVGFSTLFRPNMAFICSPTFAALARSVTGSGRSRAFTTSDPGGGTLAAGSLARLTRKL